MPALFIGLSLEKEIFLLGFLNNDIAEKKLCKSVNG